MSAANVATNGWRMRASGLGQALAVSVMATALVTSLHLYARDPAPEPAPVAKSGERLVFEVDEVAQRLTGGYEGLASFGLPFVEPKPWSDPVKTAEAAPPATVRPARTAEAEHPRADTERRIAAMLPPSRPASLPVAAAPIVLASATPVGESAAPDRRLRVFGLGLPGTEFIPTPREAVGHVAALGQVIASAGEAVGDAVLPR